MAHIIKGNAALLVRGKTSIPELREKFSDDVVKDILHECMSFLSIDKQVKEWARNGVSIWKTDTGEES
jgi:thymidylate synthase